MSLGAVLPLHVSHDESQELHERPANPSLRRVPCVGRVNKQETIKFNIIFVKKKRGISSLKITFLNYFWYPGSNRNDANYNINAWNRMKRKQVRCLCLHLTKRIHVLRFLFVYRYFVDHSIRSSLVTTTLKRLIGLAPDSFSGSPVGLENSSPFAGVAVIVVGLRQDMGDISDVMYKGESSA